MGQGSHDLPHKNNALSNGSNGLHRMIIHRDAAEARSISTSMLANRHALIGYQHQLRVACTDLPTGRRLTPAAPWLWLKVAGSEARPGAKPIPSPRDCPPLSSACPCMQLRSSMIRNIQKIRHPRGAFQIHCQSFELTLAAANVYICIRMSDMHV